MGKSSVEIEYDIERQRQRLTARISRLDRRVRDDIESVKDEVRERAHQAEEKAKEAASKTRDVAKDRASEARDGEHPVAFPSIAFGAGAILGWASGRGSERKLDREVARHRHDDERSRLAGIVSSVVHSAMSYAGSQSAGLAKTAAKKGATTAVKSVRSGDEEDPVEAHRREHEELRRAGIPDRADGRAIATRRANEVVAEREAELSEPRPV